MKRILIGLLSLLLICRNDAWAGTCETNLGNTFTPAQQVTLCTKLGDVFGDSLIPSTTNTYDLGSASKVWKTIYGGGINQQPNTAIFVATPVAGTNVLVPGYNVPAATATASTKVFVGAAIPTPGDQFEFYNQSAATLHLAVPTVSTLNGATQGGYLAVASKISASCKTVSGTNIECRLNVNPTPAGP